MFDLTLPIQTNDGRSQIDSHTRAYVPLTLVEECHRLLISSSNQCTDERDKANAGSTHYDVII